MHRPRVGGCVHRVSAAGVDPVFDRFLNVLGDRVPLKGWPHYRAGLDVGSTWALTRDAHWDVGSDPARWGRRHGRGGLRLAWRQAT